MPCFPLNGGAWARFICAAGILLACEGNKRYFYVAVDRVDRVTDPSGSGDHTDPSLVNPIALQVSPNGSTWTANNATGTLTAFAADGSALPEGAPLAIALPVPAALGAAPSRPTGLVYYGGRGLLIESAGRRDSARYLVATEEGTILGYNNGVDPTSAIIAVDNSAAGAVYRGLAIAETRSSVRLYATNFAAGTIDVFDEDFAPETGLAAAAFEDQELPLDYAPFGIQRVGNVLYVTYAARSSDGQSLLPGGGVLDLFALDGRFLRRVASGEPLNQPWGLSLAPPSFPYYGQALLVGNHGDGLIHAFDPWWGDVVGVLWTEAGGPVVIDGLWDLAFTPGADGRYELTFTAGGASGETGMLGSLPTHLVRSDPPPSLDD